MLKIFKMMSRLIRAVRGSRTMSTIDSQRAIILSDLYKKADANGDGVLSPTEIREHLAPNIGLEMNSEEVEDFIKRADVNNDGRVDYEEFLRLLTAQDE